MPTGELTSPILLPDRLASRRRWLKASLAGAAVAAIGSTGPTVARGAAGAAGSRRRSLRVAHLTDVHVQPERGAERGLAAALAHAQSQSPDLILNTGDCIMDAFRRDADRTELQWRIWENVLRRELSVPMHSCLGNHDIWGWDKRRSRTTGEERQWGKRRGLDALALDHAYYSFDRNGWHVVMLDSVVPFGEDAYRATLGAEQLAWLEADLAAAPADHFVLIASHIPIFSIAGVLNSCGESKATPGELAASGGAMHLDAAEIHALFKKFPNVRACLSGHLHVIDRADYFGVSYLSNPAVSGNWWKGAHLNRFAEGYTLLDLYDDGTFDVQYPTYGWQAEPETAPTTRPIATSDRASATQPVAGL